MVVPDSPELLRRRSRSAPVVSVPRWRARLLNYLVVFVVFVLVVDALFGSRGMLETMRARRQFAALAAALAQTRRDNDRLRDQIRRLRTDPETIESVAREELGLVRDDEVVFIIHDEK